jgi:hypothetical protein
VSIFLKSGSLNLLEPSGPVKACNGIALPYVFDYAHFVEQYGGACNYRIFR